MHEEEASEFTDLIVCPPGKTTSAKTQESALFSGAVARRKVTL